MMFFLFNSEKRIGIKRLSDADLGLNDTSHQTHIGLYEKVLTFLDNRDEVKDGLLIYKDKCEVLECLFDRIMNPDGSFRSPKIKSGYNDNSIVDRIRDIAKQKPNAQWYLAWAGMESKQLVFWLFDGDSESFKILSRHFEKLDRLVLEEGENGFQIVEELLKEKLNANSLAVQKEIETASQTGKNRRKYRQFDLEKADKLFRQIGKEGERLIAEYLERKKAEGLISSFNWMNASRESGEPFDFIVNENLSDELFIDVKSTRFEFDQKIYFSNDEISFVESLRSDNRYAVYRLYDMKNPDRKLRICEKCQGYMDIANKCILDFQNTMESHHTIASNIKLGVKPNDCFKAIAPTIKL